MKNAKNKIFLIGLIFIIGIAASFFFYQIIKNWQKTTTLESYELLTEQWTNDLQRAIDQQVEILYSLQAFYEGSQFVSRQEFKAFVQNTLQRHPEIQSLEWIPRIPKKNLTQFKKDYTQEFQEGFEVLTYSLSDQRVKVPLEEAHFAVIYMEPFEENKTAWGRDYSRNPKIIQAMEKARDTGLPSLSDEFKLHRIKDPHKKMGSILFLPIYKLQNPQNLEERRESLSGFVALVLRADLLIEKVCKKILPFTQITLYDETKNILYASPSPFKEEKNLFTHEQKLSLADSFWLISFQSNVNPLESFRWEAEGELVTGILVTLFVCFYLSSLIYQNKKILKEVDKKTESLRYEIKARENIEMELNRSNQDLQHFAYVASHDLQEPLRKILAFGEMLEEKSADKLGMEEKDYLQRMLNASQRMKTLIEDLLKYSRLSRQQQSYTKVDLNKLLQEVLSDLEVRILETKGKVEASKLPTLDADPLEMRQLFQNLISNALKFHKAGQGSQVWIKSENKEGQTIISIEDNGIGFDLKYRDQIFQPFQRLHGRGEYEGSGIGLAICQKIVEKHKGKIEVESEEGKGSRFVIELPLTQN